MAELGKDGRFTGANVNGCRKMSIRKRSFIAGRTVRGQEASSTSSQSSRRLTLATDWMHDELSMADGCEVSPSSTPGARACPVTQVCRLATALEVIDANLAPLVNTEGRRQAMLMLTASPLELRRTGSNFFPMIL